MKDGPEQFYINRLRHEGALEIDKNAVGITPEGKATAVQGAEQVLTHGNATEKKRRLGYTVEFKKFISENPNFISTVIRLCRALSQKTDSKGYRSLDEAEISVTLLEGGKAPKFLVSKGDNRFFIKSSEATTRGDRGIDQLEASALAREKLANSHLAESVEVVDYQLGYSDKNKTYFVSKYSTVARSPLSISRSWLTSEQIEDALRKLDAAQEVLDEFFDINARNVAYNEDTKKLVLFDLSTKQVVEKHL